MYAYEIYKHITIVRLVQLIGILFSLLIHRYIEQTSKYAQLVYYEAYVSWAGHWSLAGSTDTGASIRYPEHLVSVVSYHSIGSLSFHWLLTSCSGCLVIHDVIDQEELVAPLLNTFTGFTERHGSERLTWCIRSGEWQRNGHVYRIYQQIRF